MRITSARALIQNRFASTAFLILMIMLPAVIPVAGLSPYSTIVSTGNITEPPYGYVTVDFGKAIALNNLSLGVNIDNEWENWLCSSPLRSKAAACNFKLVRLYDFRLGPCVSWNDSAMAGVFEWSSTDSIVQSIFDIGAEPLICVGGFNIEGLPLIPDGMGVNSTTGLPFLKSFSTYVSVLAKHLIDIGFPARFWEIWNEPNVYFFNRDSEGKIMWGSTNMTRTAYFVDSFNAVSTRLHSFDSTALVGTDASLFKDFLNFFVQFGDGVGFLSFHYYTAWGTWLDDPSGYLDDSVLLSNAGELGSDISWNDLSMYNPNEARRLWSSLREVDLPMICSEANLNSAWQNGTDPRIQQVIGAIWYSEVLRNFISYNVNYCLYYTFASDDSPLWNSCRLTKGYGFGLVNMTPPHEEWYPYVTNCLLGDNLEINDPIFDVQTSNSSITAFAWKNADYYELLINCKTPQEIKVGVQVEGITRIVGECKFFCIDHTLDGLQVKTVSFSDKLDFIVRGYSTILLRF